MKKLINIICSIFINTIIMMAIIFTFMLIGSFIEWRWLNFEGVFTESFNYRMSMISSCLCVIVLGRFKIIKE